MVLLQIAIESAAFAQMSVKAERQSWRRIEQTGNAMKRTFIAGFWWQVDGVFKRPGCGILPSLSTPRPQTARSDGLQTVHKTHAILRYGSATTRHARASRTHRRRLPAARAERHPHVAAAFAAGQCNLLLAPPLLPTHAFRCAGRTVNRTCAEHAFIIGDQRGREADCACGGRRAVLLKFLPELYPDQGVALSGSCRLVLAHLCRAHREIEEVATLVEQVFDKKTSRATNPVRLPPSGPPGRIQLLAESGTDRRFDAGDRLGASTRRVGPAAALA